jgi:hypothetical protein
MSMSADLRDRLEAAGVAGGAVFRDVAPSGRDRPFVILQTISDPRLSTYDGRQAFRETRVQADCQALSRKDADDIAEAVIAAAETGGTFGTTKFTRAFVDSLRTYSDSQSGTGTIYVTSLDLMIWHAPAA